MSMPFYVAPEQLMKDKADYARKNIARGRSLVAAVYADGVVLATENPRARLKKIGEIYDRIAFAGVGRYNEFEQLRVAGVRHADLKGYAYSRDDVDARSLASSYAQILDSIFTRELKPMEIEILVAEVGLEAGEDRLFRILYDGQMFQDEHYSVLGGDAEAINERMEATYAPGQTLAETLKLCVTALAGPERTLGPGDLEVAMLARPNGRRSFRRLEGDELGALLA